MFCNVHFHEPGLAPSVPPPTPSHQIQPKPPLHPTPSLLMMHRPSCSDTPTHTTSTSELLRRLGSRQTPPFFHPSYLARCTRALRCSSTTRGSSCALTSSSSAAAAAVATSPTMACCAWAGRSQVAATGGPVVEVEADAAVGVAVAVVGTEVREMTGQTRAGLRLEASGQVTLVETTGA